MAHFLLLFKEMRALLNYFFARTRRKASLVLTLALLTTSTTEVASLVLVPIQDDPFQLETQPKIIGRLVEPKPKSDFIKDDLRYGVFRLEVFGSTHIDVEPGQSICVLSYRGTRNKEFTQWAQIPAKGLFMILLGDPVDTSNDSELSGCRTFMGESLLYRGITGLRFGDSGDLIIPAKDFIKLNQPHRAVEFFKNLDEERLWKLFETRQQVDAETSKEKWKAFELREKGDHIDHLHP